MAITLFKRQRLLRAGSIFLIGLGSLLTSTMSSVSAHPVTFEDGIAISLLRQSGVTLWHANYSLSSSLSVGADYLRLGDQETTQFGLARVNYLVKRWLGKGRQGNLYLLTGAGVGKGGGATKGDKDDFRFAWMGGLQADFETQRVYTALIGRAIGDQEPSLNTLSYHALYRLGFAPYVAHSSELQSWLVGQVAYHNEMTGLPNFTLLMRVFHRSALWELGADLKGRPWIHIMAHF